VLGASPHRDAAAFVVVDMSSVDMGHAAGASRDNVGGLEPAEFLAIVGRLASTVRLLGMAIVNLAPDRDPRGHSERLAARALLTLLDPRLQRVVA
jgi:arginase family enzyme